MKKIILALYFSFMVYTSLNSLVFADEIINAKGTIVPCKIETVEGGYIEYRKNGTLYNFAREEESPIFNDYVDIRTKLFKKNSTERISGKIVVKDMWSTIIRNDSGQIDIPFFRVKFIGVYKP